MSVYIIKPGVLTTVQDGGRPGGRAMGIAPGGVMDIFAATMAQKLALNPANSAVLEMHYPAPELLFETDCLVGVTGGDFDMHINGAPASNWQSHIIEAGTIVSFRALKKGFRAYLAVHGGLALAAWLNSYTTHTVTGQGGFKGRALQKHDRIYFNNPAPGDIAGYQSVIRPAMINTVYNKEPVIDCIPGPEFDWLPAAAQQKLQQGDAEFTIESNSNRMAYRLAGAIFNTDQPAGSMLSSAVCFGTVQLLPNGNPLILMADHQVTGGYPRILSVTAASLPLLAQMRPGTKFHFRLVSLQQAEHSLAALQQLLQPTAI